LITRSSAATKAAHPLASSKSYILASTLPPKYRIPAILPPSIAPTASTEAAYTALYTMIIALISLFGGDGKLSAAKLDQYLRRMNADVNMPMDKTEAMLQKMIKQGYLVKIKENTGNEETIDWMVGPRGKVEVGNKGVKGLVEEVYGDEAPDDLADRINSSLGLRVSMGEREEDAPLAEVVENSQAANRRPRRSGRRGGEEDD
jgi:melanoma-associated antigen